jgi:hypothetical protein
LNEKRVQLWTDNSFSEFAIVYDSRIVARTKQDANYNRMIDESSYVDGYQYDWNYTLSQWVPFYFSNKYISQALGRRKVAHKFKMEVGSDIDNHQNSLFRVRERRVGQAKPKPVLKCHFCNLRYFVEEERTDHEKFWHSKNLR